MTGAPVQAPLQPPADPGEPRKHKRRWVKVLIIIGSILALIAALAAGTAYIAYQKFGQIKVISAPTEAETAPSSPMNILLMGSDTRTGPGNNRYGLDAGRRGARSDTTILLHLNADHTHALAVSIPRDLWVHQPQCANPDNIPNYYFKFNNAFDAGGAACTTQMVKDLTGLPINHIVVVDFMGFKRMVDAMGGVEVCLARPVDDTAAKLNLPAGTSTVMGNQALAFVRARKSLGDGSDIGRIERQQAFLSSAIRKATSTALLLNPGKLYQVLDTATQALTVDQSLDSVSAMTQFAQSMRDVKPENITFTTLPFVYRTDGANVDPDVSKDRPIWNAMRNDTTWPPPISVGPDGKKLSVPAGDLTVNVVNSSGGAVSDSRVRTQLEAAGFQVASVNDGQSRPATRVTYQQGSADSARTLGYATSAVMVEDSGAYGLTLDVGKDWTGVKSDIVVQQQKDSGVDPSMRTGGQVNRANKTVCAS